MQFNSRSSLCMTTPQICSSDLDLTIAAHTEQCDVCILHCKPQMCLKYTPQNKKTVFTLWYEVTMFALSHYCTQDCNL